jgi:hypothetical protein
MPVPDVSPTVARQPGASGTRSSAAPGGVATRNRWSAVAASAVTVSGAPAPAVSRPGSSHAPAGSGCGRRQAWL